MLEKTGQTALAATASRKAPPLVIRRVDAIPVALPLKAPMKMAAETVVAAQNLIVRIDLGNRALQQDAEQRLGGQLRLT